jgi:hypothetical protein
MIACRNATGKKRVYLSSPVRGDIKYSALTGLAMKIMIGILGRCSRLLYCRPFRAFQKSFLELNFPLPSHIVPAAQERG